MDPRDGTSGTQSSSGANDTRPRSEVATGLHETADTARDLAHTLERGANALDSASRTATTVEQKMDRVASAASDARASLMTQVRAHPMLALATAAAVGFIAARSGS